MPYALKKYFVDPGAALARYEDIRRERMSAVVHKSHANRRQGFNPALADQDEASVAEQWQQTLARERLDWLYNVRRHGHSDLTVFQTRVPGSNEDWNIASG